MPVCWPTCSGAITCPKYGNLTQPPADSDDSLTDAQPCAQTAQLSKTAYTPLWHEPIQAPVQDLFSAKGIQWLRTCTTDPELDPDVRAALASDLRLLQAVQAELDALDQQLAALAYPVAQVKLLMTLPGVDYPTALALLAAWGTIERFSTPAQAA